MKQEPLSRAVGYKIMFSTHLSHDEIEDAIDEFLRNVDAKEMVAHAEEMSDAEIQQIISSYKGDFYNLYTGTVTCGDCRKTMRPLRVLFHWHLSANKE